jgi:hypothetical protein
MSFPVTWERPRAVVLMPGGRFVVHVFTVRQLVRQAVGQ